MRRTVKKLKRWKKAGLGVLVVVLVVVGILYAFTFRPSASYIEYGVSFSKYEADTLDLDWKKTYNALLTDLKVRRFRLSAHWPMVEPRDDEFQFEELDYQVQKAREHDASIILTVGRRVPGWPECHVPSWAAGLSEEQKQREVKEMIRRIVTRYKNEPHLIYWQVENEPFLGGFAQHFCPELDVSFLEEEIELVKTLDSDTPVLLTDSGEFGRWYNVYRRADAFGTTMYLYVWDEDFGKVRYPIRPGFFDFKQNVVSLLFEDKPMFLIELGLEPWLTKPIVETPIETQLDRMGIDKFNETIRFARQTDFETQYLWGAEWWYWMKEKQDDPRFWNRAKELFGT